MSSSEEEDGGGRIRFTTEGDYEDGCVLSLWVWCGVMRLCLSPDICTMTP